MNFETMSKQRKMILIAAAVGVIAMFLPWWTVSVSVFGVSQGASESGMNGLGIIVFFCFLGAAALSLLGNQAAKLNQTNWMLTLVTGGLATLITLIKFLKQPTDQNIIFGGVSASRGIGLYLALVAAVCIVAFAFMHRTADQSLQSGFDSLKNTFDAKSNEFRSGTTTTTTPTTTISHTPTDETTRPTA